MKPEKPFFVGYLKIPAALRNLLLFVACIFLGGFVGGAYLAGASQDDPGKAGFRFDYGRQTVTGVFESRPYPILHVTEGSKRIKAGHTIMLTAGGKAGVMQDPDAHEGMLVTASGVILKRGELDMLQLRGGKQGLKLLNKEGPMPKAESLGTWRLQGEICDGKCLAGAMQPGRGLAHKACANLCLIGDIPPVFVSTQPVEGSEFLLVGDINGGMMTSALYHLVGQFVEVEAELQRRGDLLVMLIDPAKAKAIQ